jgi:hypothetical protein
MISPIRSSTFGSSTIWLAASATFSPSRSSSRCLSRTSLLLGVGLEVVTETVVQGRERRVHVQIPAPPLGASWEVDWARTHEVHPSVWSDSLRCERCAANRRRVVTSYTKSGRRLPGSRSAAPHQRRLVSAPERGPDQAVKASHQNHGAHRVAVGSRRRHRARGRVRVAWAKAGRGVQSHTTARSTLRGSSTCGRPAARRTVTTTTRRADAEPALDHRNGARATRRERSPLWIWELHKRLHTQRTLENLQALAKSKPPVYSAFAEPSDGLEPSTPSLPWRCSTD